MVMGRRPEVETAGPLGTGRALGKLGVDLARHLAVVPLHRPWEGPANPATNVLRDVMRTTVRSVMTTAMALDTPELRSLEIVLDDAAGAVMPPPWRRGIRVRPDEVGGVPGEWIEPADVEHRGAVVYFHGGGYLATTPRMYNGVASRIADATRCRIFVPDYRLAPEFPYPAALDDALAVYDALLDDGQHPTTLLLAGDSGGGGLAASLLAELGTEDRPHPAGAVLISPEIDLALTGASMESNADRDILPPDIPVTPYLAKTDAHLGTASPLYADLSDYPPLLVTAGGDEMFVDGIRAFVDWAALADIAVDYVEEPGMVHVFEIVSPLSHAAARAFDRIHHFIDGALPD